MANSEGEWYKSPRLCGATLPVFAYWSPPLTIRAISAYRPRYTSITRSFDET